MGHTSIQKSFVRWSLLVAVAWFSARGSCGADAITVEDATGRAVVISDASRIVSVGGAVTEILYVLGLGPSLVLAAEGSGPKEAIAVLEAASIPLVQIPDRFTGEGIVEKIRLIARATGSVMRGECLAKSVEA